MRPPLSTYLNADPTRGFWCLGFISGFAAGAKTRQRFYMTDCLSSKVSPDKALAPTGNRLGLGPGFQRFIQTLKLPWMRAFGPIGIPTSRVSPQPQHRFRQRR